MPTPRPVQQSLNWIQPALTVWLKLIVRMSEQVARPARITRRNMRTPTRCYRPPPRNCTSPWRGRQAAPYLDIDAIESAGNFLKNLMSLLRVHSFSPSLSMVTAPDRMAEKVDDVSKWTQKQWNAAKAKWSKEKVKWGDCQTQASKTPKARAV
jgi:hypothetical protein